MAQLERVLVVGGGICGMAVAIRLAGRGVAVDLVELDPDWKVYGAGITLTGLTLRAMADLGIYHQVAAQGAVFAGIRFRHPDGSLLLEVPASPDAAPIAQGGGILRPILHRILSTEVRHSATQVRLGVTVDRLSEADDGVDVAFSNGTTGRYDLVVGADGINSKVRHLAFPDAPPPRFTGQGAWRVVADRPPEIDRAEMYVGGTLKLGFVPVSAAEMYLFLLEPVPDNPRIEPAEYLSRLDRLLAPFGGAGQRLRARLGPASPITYRPLEWLLLPLPWHVGRIVLLGDAAHATTPHLASGAGLAIEDALVLAEELDRHASVEAALGALGRRRFDRVRLVVETSVRLGDLELAGNATATSDRMFRETMAALGAPY